MNYPKKNRFQPVPIAALCLYNNVKPWYLTIRSGANKYNIVWGYSSALTALLKLETSLLGKPHFFLMAGHLRGGGLAIKEKITFFLVHLR